jgi:CDP-paratose 2-epimerase
MHAHHARRPPRYIGFGGAGYQVRDSFHPDDLARLLWLQIHQTSLGGKRLFNASGGASNSMSLADLTAICDDYFGPHVPQPDSSERPFDLPWIVIDSGKAAAHFAWNLERTLLSILDEIAANVRTHPDWLSLCAP